MLVAEKKDGNFKGVFSQVLQDVLRRHFKMFFAGWISFSRRSSEGSRPERIPDTQDLRG